MNTNMFPGMVDPNNQFSSMNGVVGGQAMNQMSPNMPQNIPQNIPQGGQVSQYGYAEGGEVEHHGHHEQEPESQFILAHFNPHELDDLDEAQGVRTYFPGTKTRIYKRLDRHFRDNPEIVDQIIQMSHDNHNHHYANGGSVQDDIDELSHNGRYGDTTTAFITPHIRDILETARGHRSRNPHDNAPEFFDLNFGGVLNHIKNAAQGAWNGIKSAAPTAGRVLGAAAPYLGTAAGGALGTAFGVPELGMIAGGALGNLGGNALNSLSDEHGGSALSPEMTQALGTGLGSAGVAHVASRMPNSKNGPTNFSQTLGHGLSGFGQSLEENSPNSANNQTAGQLAQIGGGFLENNANPRQTIANGINNARSMWKNRNNPQQPQAAPQTPAGAPAAPPTQAAPAYAQGGPIRMNSMQNNGFAAQGLDHLQNLYRNRMARNQPMNMGG